MTTSIKLFLFSLALAVTISGCAISSRYTIRPDEQNYRFAIRHSQPQSQAFNNVEVALAEAYNDLPEVLKLKQPATGTYLLKPLVTYHVGGSIGALQHARYTLKIVVQSTTVSMTFELEPEITNHTWAPEAEIPKIRATFKSVASKVANSVNGTLQ